MNTSLQRQVFRGSVAALALLTTGLALADVGRFAIVQNQVTSMKPGGTAPLAATPGMPIVLEEEEQTQAASLAKLTIGEGGVISLGQNTRFKVSQESVDQATGAKTSHFSLLVGKARVFVSRFWGGRPEVSVDTPSAVVGIKGSEVGIEVLADGTTLVSVISGSATVLGKPAAGGPRALEAGDRWRSNGDVSSLEAAMIDDLRRQTEPWSQWSGAVFGVEGAVVAPPAVAGPGAGTSSSDGQRAVTQGTIARSATADLWADPAGFGAPGSYPFSDRSGGQSQPLLTLLNALNIPTPPQR